MRDFFRFIKQDLIVFFTHVARILIVCAFLLLLVWIIKPFENAGQIILLGLLNAFLGLSLIWLLYVIVEYFRYRKLFR